MAGLAPPEGTPYVLVEKIRGAMRITAVDAMALRLGLVPGLTLADSRARVPELEVFDAAPAEDAAWLDWLADACDRYSPSVAIDPPQALIIDVAGCGDEKAIVRDLKKRIVRQGFTANLALAETPDAAAALAQYGVKKILHLPVGALRVDSEIHLALRRAGLKTIGDLASRPRAPLAARFGTPVPHLLARLLGEQDVHIVPRRAPFPVVVEQRFAEPIARTEDMLSTITDLARQAAIAMTEQGVGGRCFEAALFRSDGHVARLAIETGGPVRDPEILDRLFRERIDTLSDPLDPGFGYDLIRLAITLTEPLATEQLRLEGGTLNDAELALLVDRLGTRLGKVRVRKFVPADTHIPEQAAFELPIAEVKPVSGWVRAEEGEPPLRPIHLFDPPHRIKVVAGLPDGPPRRFRWRQTSHDVTRYEGPERIAAEWWRRRGGHDFSDGNGARGGLTRDYYRIEDMRGRRFWVFRHGLHDTEKSDPGWYLHGIFA
ncbi:MAG: polymerase family protein [Sphingomonadales bacterium]|nr:polymerase family protein [Sphingomonadales bacterium]